MDDRSLNKMLALLVFLACAVSAFSLGALGYVFVMGELPFGIVSLSSSIQRENEAALAKSNALKARAPVDEDNKMRLDEEFLASFANDLKKEREKIAAERASLEEQRKNAEMIVKQAAAMQSEVEAKEKLVEELLKKVDAKERANVSDMQKLIAGMAGSNPAPAIDLLFSFDDQMAARILYSMNKKIAASIISTSIKDPDKKKSDRIKAITLRMQTLSDDLKEAPK